MQHFFGNAPAHEVVEAVGFQCQLYAAFVANGVTQHRLAGRFYLRKHVCQCAAGMGAYLFQIPGGFACQPFLVGGFGSHQQHVRIADEADVYPETHTAVLAAQCRVRVGLLVEVGTHGGGYG